VTRWVALLRGVNVGPHKRIAMADLRALLEGVGYDDVRTLLQSGNALFTAGGSASTHEKKISAAIEKTLGLEVSVLVRTGAEVTAVASGNPFVERRVPTKELSVAFLSKAPSAAKVEALLDRRTEFAPDDVEAGDRALYLRQPNGVIKTRIPDLDRALGVTATARNWNTVSKLVDLVVG
jgi:uncharacterized protein (DUF1697 family)